MSIKIRNKLNLLTFKFNIMNTSKPTYQLIHVDCNKSICKPYTSFKKVKDLQNTFLGLCKTEIRKTDYSNLSQIVTVIK